MMITRNIINRRDFSHRHIHDVKRIQDVLYDNGYNADLQDCANLWESISETQAAGWLILPEDDCDLFQELVIKIEG